MDKRSLNRILTLLVKKSRVRGHIDSAKVKRVLKVIRKLPYPSSIIILKEYKKRIEPLWARDTLTIESGVALKRREIGAITRVLKRRHGFVNIAKKINRDLLGGLRISIGSVVYDFSVARHIERLQEKFFFEGNV